MLVRLNKQHKSIFGFILILLFIPKTTIAKDTKPTNKITQWIPSSLMKCPKTNIAPWNDWKLVEGLRSFKTKIDIDGDGYLDSLEVEESHGNYYSFMSVTLLLSSSGEKIEVDTEASIAYFTNITLIPKILSKEKNRCALAFVEAALLFNISEQIDPSLEWLLSHPKRIREGLEFKEIETAIHKTRDDTGIKWYEGAPKLPSHYTVRIKGNNRIYWVSYAGNNHKQRKKSVIFTILAEKNDRVLLGTTHAVILSNKKRTQFAWIYVNSGGSKLRWPTITSASIEKDTAIIGVSSMNLIEGEKPEVKVNLKSGKLYPPVIDSY